VSRWTGGDNGVRLPMVLVRGMRFCLVRQEVGTSMDGRRPHGNLSWVLGVYRCVLWSTRAVVGGNLVRIRPGLGITRGCGERNR